MKKKLCIILACLAVFSALLFWAYDYFTDLLVKKTLIMVSSDPQIKEEFEKAMSQALETQNKSEEDGIEAPPQNAPEESPDKPKENDEKTPSVKTKDGSLSIDDLQPTDKEYVMSIYKRFSASEVSQVSGMLSGGITPEEKQIIKSIVYAKVSQAEVNKLFAIAKKYQ